uniref:Uncharacterized protein n=1 Tax=Pristionchus pacificus TaxID=54126 RepID=A0A2A6CI08_PRIPA|eukprot:PDM77730.1 hypothetical protein PRIPAC_34597 [Pristionchus pacificus]
MAPMRAMPEAAPRPLARSVTYAHWNAPEMKARPMKMRPITVFLNGYDGTKTQLGSQSVS